MQQKLKFIIFISLICFISLLFVQGKVFAAELCTMEAANCENVYDPETGTSEAVCDGYEEVCIETEDEEEVTATTKEKEKYYYNTCNRNGWPWNWTWKCVRTFHYIDGVDQCQVDSDCGNGGTTDTTEPTTDTTDTTEPTTDTTTTESTATTTKPQQWGCLYCDWHHGEYFPGSGICGKKYFNSPCTNKCRTDADCEELTTTTTTTLPGVITTTTTTTTTIEPSEKFDFSVYSYSQVKVTRPSSGSV